MYLFSQEAQLCKDSLCFIHLLLDVGSSQPSPQAEPLLRTEDLNTEYKLITCLARTLVSTEAVENAEDL